VCRDHPFSHLLVLVGVNERYGEGERQATKERERERLAIIQAIDRWRHYTLDHAVVAASVV